ncbi:MAG: hypothetical protein EBZ52_07290 [Actinobacteria bacterium]|nr:hypothetical protein [Actinomycetota bacterium]
MDAMPLNALAVISPSQFKALTPAVIASMSPEQRNALPQQALNPAANAAPTNVANATALAGALTGWNVDKVPATAFANFKPADAAKLSPQVFSSLNPDQFKAMPPTAFTGLKPTQVGALPTEVLAAMKPTQFASMPAAALGSLNSEQFHGDETDSSWGDASCVDLKYEPTTGWRSAGCSDIWNESRAG